jgi:lysophospholipase L1-like esterase
MSNLTGKTLVALGDSLIYGSKLGNEATWVNKLAKKHNMTVYNHGINGCPVAQQTIEPQRVPMCVRYADMEDSADYVVVLGGANDKRLHVPLGEIDSQATSTFCGALNTLILGITAKYPKAKFLFLTNYDRWRSKNNEGLSDIDYVDAMIAVCARWGMPCFDNYRNAGFSFYNPAQCEWIDEGCVLEGKSNRHFSDEGYDFLLTRYEALLEAL